MSRTRQQVEADYEDALDLISGFLVLSYHHVRMSEDVEKHYETWHKQVHYTAVLFGLDPQEVCDIAHEKSRRYQEVLDKEQGEGQES